MTTRALSIPELLTSILVHLPLYDILANARRVSRQWKDLIDTSPALLWATFRFGPSECFLPSLTSTLMSTASAAQAALDVRWMTIHELFHDSYQTEPVDLPVHRTQHIEPSIRMIEVCDAALASFRFDVARIPPQGKKQTLNFGRRYTLRRRDIDQNAMSKLYVTRPALKQVELEVFVKTVYDKYWLEVEGFKSHNKTILIAEDGKGVSVYQVLHYIMKSRLTLGYFKVGETEGWIHDGNRSGVVKIVLVTDDCENFNYAELEALSNMPPL